MKRGEIRWFSFQPPDKRRPVLVMTRDSALRYLTVITVAPITSIVRNIPTEVLLIPEDDGVNSICAVNLDNLQTISKAKVGPLVTVLSSLRMREVNRALCFALGIDELL